MEGRRLAGHSASARGGRVETHFCDDIGHAEIVGGLSELGYFLAPVRSDVVVFVTESPIRPHAHEPVIQQAAGGSDPDGQAIGE